MNNPLEKRGLLKKAAIIVALAVSLLIPGSVKGKDKPAGAVLTAMRMMFARELSGQMMRTCEEH